MMLSHKRLSFLLADQLVFLVSHCCYTLCMPLQLLHASQLTVDLPAPIQPLSLNQVHVVSFSITGALVGAILFYM